MAIDPFEIPAAAKPEWMTYQWVRKSLLGVEDDYNLKRSGDAGWHPVPFARHRNLAASKMWKSGTDIIEYGGLMLMERPDHMTLASLANLRRQAFEVSGVSHAWVQAIKNPPVGRSKWKRIMAIIKGDE